MNLFSKTPPEHRVSTRSYPVHATITGPVVLIGLGSIGKGLLPLLERHIAFDRSKLTVIDPDPVARRWLAATAYTVLTKGITRENHVDVLGPLLEAPGAFCINLSVNTSSSDLVVLCRARGALYIDTVIEPWPGFYFGERSNAERSNYALREEMRALARAAQGGVTAVSCCGANPGMVSWFVKEALMRLAVDLGAETEMPQDRKSWALLMRGLGVKGIHIAERDTQVSNTARRRGRFVNTWSVDGFLSEAFQPAELGWGTHETWMPENAHTHADGSRAALWLDRPGAETRVRTWCPSFGPQYGYLVTHNEAISIAEYFTVGAPEAPIYRPTCQYAYHPCEDAILSLHEACGSGHIPKDKLILEAEDIVGGADELGVLLYGHARNALWYGSRLTNAEARGLAPSQNATGLQVTSAVLSGIVWALENPRAGLVEAEEMDHRRCLQIQRPYLGSVGAHYTDWTPLDAIPTSFRSQRDLDAPWSFRNVLVN